MEAARDGGADRLDDFETEADQVADALCAVDGSAVSDPVRLAEDMREQAAALLGLALTADAVAEAAEDMTELQAAALLDA